MENTCNKDCPLWKKYKENCPNCIESWWTPEGEGKEPILVKDCAPKRTFIMIQGLHNRLVGVEQSQEQQRNEMNGFSKVMKIFIIALKQNIITSYTKKKKDIATIENKNASNQIIKFSRSDNRGGIQKDF